MSGITQLEVQRDTVRNLTVFVVVARELSFTRAAAILGVSQSALSFTIKTLEERLGVRLLTRTTRSVGLTEAGEQLFDSAVVHLEGIQQALADLTSFRDKPAGMVRLATSDHAARTVLNPVLTKLLPAYPDITVELVVDNALTDIAAQRCDAGVRLGEHLAHDMIAARIGPDERMAVVGTPDYFGKRGRPKTPDDLMQHNCLSFRLETHGNIYAWEFEKTGKAGKAINVRPQGQVVCNDPAQLISYCLSGIGLACMQESYFLDSLADGRLERVLADWCPRFSGYHIYYPSRRQPTAAFKIVLEALKAAAA